jgi:hypothetical protein
VTWRGSVDFIEAEMRRYNGSPQDFRMKTRKMVKLSPRLDGELRSYAATAVANSSANRGITAAVAISAIGLSLAPGLSAEIVYTPANQTIGKSVFGQGAFSTLQVDLNNDGIPDFTVSAYNLLSFSSGYLIVHAVGAAGLQSNLVLANDKGLALAGVQGQVIGPAAINARSQFRKYGEMAQSLDAYGGEGTTFHTSAGYWFNVKNRYLGIKFSIDGETHYGWARLNASPGHATLTGYAYETEPNKPIPAGAFETAPPADSANPEKGTDRASLGRLARGAAPPFRSANNSTSARSS